MIIQTREEWLVAMTAQMRPLFETAGGVLLPAKVRVSCGWPSARGLVTASSKSRTVGQCWPTEFSADGTPEVFVSPYVAEGVQVGAVLVHELVHVVDNCESGHGKGFRRLALRVGLEGKMTSTRAGVALEARLNALVEMLGPYPHASLDRSLAKKQGTRMIKVVCPACGYTVRTTAKWIEAGLPTCVCGDEMEVAL